MADPERRECAKCRRQFAATTAAGAFCGHRVAGVTAVAAPPPLPRPPPGGPPPDELMPLHLKIGQRLGPSQGSTDLRVVPGEQVDASARERDPAVAPPGQGALIETARELLTTLAPSIADPSVPCRSCWSLGCSEAAHHVEERETGVVRLPPGRRGARLVLLALLLLACARGPSDEELVRGVYREYRDAMTQGNLPRLRGLVSAPRREELDRPEASQIIQLARELTPSDVEVKAVAVSGTQATLEAEGSTGAGRAAGRLRFVKESDGWRVDKEEWSVTMAAESLPGGEPAPGPLLPDPSMPPRPHAVLEGHTAEVSRLAYTPGGHHLVSVSHGDFTLRTWEAESGRPVATARSEHRITDLALAPTGLHVYTADAAGQVAIWPLRSGQLGPPLRLLADAGQALAVSADGRWLATAGFGKPVRVWSLPDGHPVVDLGGPPTQRALAFLASGALLTAGDGTTYSVFAKTPGRLWGERWEEGRRAIGGVAPTSQIGSLDVTRDGALLVTGHNDSSIVVLDLRTRSERFNFFVRDAATRAVRWSPDGALLATAHQDATVYLWDGRTAKRLGALREHRGPVASLAFSPDGGTLASGGEDGRIVLWRGRPPGS